MNKDILSVKSASDVSQILKVPVPELQQIIHNKEKYYRSFVKKKRDGRPRQINPPIKLLRSIQDILKEYIQKKVRWTRCVHGGIEKRGIVTNAKPHIDKYMVVCLDISNFFPSTTKEQVYKALIRCGCQPEAAEYMAELTTFRGVLPQGASTSTLIGNLVLEPMDSEFLGLSRRHALTYTRFVDDITISGDKDLNHFKSAFINNVKNAGYSVSSDKIRFQPKSQQQVVTGLIVNKNLRPTSGFLGKLKREIKECWTPEGLSNIAAYYSMEKKQLQATLYGKVNHVWHVRRKLGNRFRGYMDRINWSSEVPEF